MINHGHQVISSRYTWCITNQILVSKSIFHCASRKLCIFEISATFSILSGSSSSSSGSLSTHKIVVRNHIWVFEHFFLNWRPIGWVWLCAVPHQFEMWPHHSDACFINRITVYDHSRSSHCFIMIYVTVGNMHAYYVIHFWRFVSAMTYFSNSNHFTYS